ncbi:hypothetical protein ACOZ4N_07215 [Halorientalis pallida]|uniref:hypothetical protein n=1 Tax=Halorientalis pallida TaxID=2479928 RepID=UPI003C7019B6
MVLSGCSGYDPTTAPESDAGAFTEPDVHPGLTATVDIQNLARAPVHITITELNENGRGVVLGRTYDDRTTIEFDKKDVFRENGDYRVEIRVNGTIEWNRTVQHFESYELRVETNGTVSVVTHAVA